MVSILDVYGRNSDVVGMDGVRQFCSPHATLLQASLAR